MKKKMIIIITTTKVILVTSVEVSQFYGFIDCVVPVNSNTSNFSQLIRKEAIHIGKRKNLGTNFEDETDKLLLVQEHFEGVSDVSSWGVFPIFQKIDGRQHKMSSALDILNSAQLRLSKRDPRERQWPIPAKWKSTFV